MGYVIKEYWEPGTELTVRNRAGHIRATVTQLPCVSPLE
jgi:hypothetical protein